MFCETMTSFSFFHILFKYGLYPQSIKNRFTIATHIHRIIDTESEGSLYVYATYVYMHIQTSQLSFCLPVLTQHSCASPFPRAQQ